MRVCRPKTSGQIQPHPHATCRCDRLHHINTRSRILHTTRRRRIIADMLQASI